MFIAAHGIERFSSRTGLRGRGASYGDRPMTDVVTQNPFAILSLIAAPAVLTNATSVLALSTSNRFLRAGERLRLVTAEYEKATKAEDRGWRLVHIGRIEAQALLLLHALRRVYVALGSFVSACLVSILGAALAAQQMHPVDFAMMVLALVIGFVGAGALVWGCVNLFRATRLSMMNISEEAAIIQRKAKEREAGFAAARAGD